MRKPNQTRLELLRRLTASASATALLIASTAQAAPVLPSGGAVAAGTATITQPAPGNALITQQSQKAVINWQNFSIGSGGSVTFQQPNASAIALNRVVGSDPSTINGSLSANGQVWLLNGNGILFGKGSSINVGGLIATTSDLKDGDFLSGNYAFSGASADPDAGVVNQGSIKAATGGTVVLSANHVANSGVIAAKLGQVVLGGASAFSVDFDGDNLLRYQVTKPVSAAPVGADGKPVQALVSNSGTIAAAGGTVTMTARAARNVVDNVINSSGVVEAKSASVQNGVVIFDAGEGGTVQVSGTVDVSGTKSGQTGGTIKLTGDTVAVADGARLNASGDAGGGTVLVGGNLHGAGPLPNAQTVTVGNAIIAADAVTSGKGGTVAIISTGQTNVAATISARGGATGGDGGTVETSGANLDVTGVRVDASAAAGASGLWLLDPTNVNIGTAMAATIVDELNNQHTDVSVTAPSGGSINVNAPVIYSSANSFTLLAGGSLTFNASVQNSGTGAIFGVAGWDGVTPAASILTTPGAYGLNNGTVVIGTGSASGGVAVGSFGGATTIAGYDLAVVAASGYAQLGYHGSAGSGTATGAIAVDLTADLILGAGSNGSGKYAQIGDGNNQSSNDSNAAITITAAGNVHTTGGAGGGAYALIGNGGLGGGGSQSGNITVSAGANVAIAGGTGSTAQIGNSGSVVNGSVLLASAGDITLGAGSILTANAAGDALVIAAGDDFINQAGTGALNVTQGRWLAFLNSPSGNATGLTASPYYNRVFNFLTDTYAAVTSAGNRFVYALAPVLTVAIDNKTKIYGTANPAFTATISGGLPGDASTGVYTGAPALGTSAVANSNIGDYAITGSLGTLVSDYNYGFQFVSGNLHIDPATLTASLSGTVLKTYDGTTAATLAAGNYQLSGVVPGDSVTLNDPASGLYDTRNVGTEKTVSVSGLVLAGAGKGNYVLASSSVSGAVGEIDAATLTASLTGTVQKTYDGNNAATLAAGNYKLSGVISEDNVSLNNPVSGSYDTKNAGTGKTVSVSGLALGGADKGNYVLDSTSISGAVGEIDAATLTASLTGTVQKTYDGNTTAALTADNYQLSGVISEDNVTLNNPASGNYDTKNAGTEKTVSVGGLVLGGADKGNYVLDSTSISGAVGEIDAATLTASLTGTVQKTYDGNTAAALTADNYQLSGVVPEDDVSLNNPTGGSYDTKNVGTEKTVSVSGLALGGADKGNYVLDSTSISGAVGEIDAATLTASLTGTVKKTYDGNTSAALTAGNYQLSGVISEDSVTLNNPASGSYDTKNAGTEKTVSVNGLVLGGTDKGNYVLDSTSISGAVGEIDAATLTASLTGTVQKTYDGNAAASLTAGNYQLSGVISEDNVSLNNPANGSYDTKNVGSEKTVNVSGLALGGADRNNYVLASTSISGTVGEIDAATLTASLTGTVQKPYDGTATATLAAGNYQLAGAVSGDSVSLNNPATGVYDTPDAGTGKTVSVSGLALLGADRNNYVLASNNIAANIGIIGAITLTASLTGTVQKTYDGTTAATLGTGNYQLSGVVSGDNVSLNDPTSGLYDTKNVGSEKTVSVGGLALSGADKNNYVLASTSISGAVGEIDAATLTAILTGSVQKTYDGTTAATLAQGNYKLSGVISGDSVSLNNPVSGSYDNKNAGSEKTVSVNGLALQGTDKGNYILAASNISAAIGSITAATLTASLTGTVQKTYDGTTTAALMAGNYRLSGVISEDSVTLNNPATGSYDTKNAGTAKTVSVSGLALGGADKNNYVLASTNISAAIGSISAATLTASLTGTVQKTYDGTATATLAAGNYQLSGVISEDNVSLNNPVSGSYDTKNAGTGKAVSVGGLALAGTDRGNYVLASSSISATIGSISAATLTASLTGTVQKTYDGTTTATLATGNYQLFGAISGDNVSLSSPASGSYDTKNAGTGKTVSVGGLALTGADKGNYVLASSSLSGAIGNISAATLTASLTGTVQKTYDGTTTATLGTGNYKLSGVVSEDNVSLNNPATGSYDTKNVGTGKTVSVSGLALAGTDKSNYVLASSSISAAIGSISAATLTASLTGTVQKTYDGTTTATLGAGNYQLSGAASGDSVSLSSPTGGSYDTRNAGTGKTVSISGLALTGADKGNYVLSISSLSAAIGSITPATVTASLTGTVQKVYDGTVAAVLAAANYALSGVLGSDSVSLNNPPSGSFASATAGTGKTVSVSGLALQGADQGNYVLASTTVSGTIGTITGDQTTPDVVQILGNTFTSNAITGPQSPIIPTQPPPANPGTSSSDATYATSDTGAPSDAAASKVGQSLSGAPGSVPSSTYVVIQGLLRQFQPPPGGARPHGVPPFGQVYSSWGNEAFWQ